MKVLWLCNIMLPEVMRIYNKEPIPVGGWLSGMLEGIFTHSDSVRLSICMPCGWIDAVKTGKTSHYEYYLFPFDKSDIETYHSKIALSFKTILNEVEPDIVHIWGTELPSALAMVNACESRGILDRVVVNIQGLVSIIAKHYYTALPWTVVYDFMVPRYFVSHDCIAQQKKAFEKRGIYEVKALNKVKHVIGRTEWDRACVMQINSDVHYHFCSEILRNVFYNYKWDIANCEKFSIFVSQASYPIKGLHLVLEAMPQLIKTYPHVHLYVAGSDVTCSTGGIKERLKLSTYGKYIKRLVIKYNLTNYITFCGPLDEQQMCQRYLKSNVFLSPSLVENESNSISEAKILGMPVVASYVGGVVSRISHTHDGLLYQCDAPYMLAYYVDKVFSDPSYAVSLGVNARAQALKVNDKEKNTSTMLHIYKTIIGENKL